MKKIYNLVAGSKANIAFFMGILLVVGYVAGFVMIKANII